MEAFSWAEAFHTMKKKSSLTGSSILMLGSEEAPRRTLQNIRNISRGSAANSNNNNFSNTVTSSFNCYGPWLCNVLISDWQVLDTVTEFVQTWNTLYAEQAWGVQPGTLPLPWPMEPALHLPWTLPTRCLWSPACCGHWCWLILKHTRIY